MKFWQWEGVGIQDAGQGKQEIGLIGKEEFYRGLPSLQCALAADL